MEVIRKRYRGVVRKAGNGIEGKKEKERKKEMEEQLQWDMATERSASSRLLQGIGAATYNQY